MMSPGRSCASSSVFIVLPPPRASCSRNRRIRWLLKPEAIALRAILKGPFAAFQDVAHRAPDLRRLKRTALVRDDRHAARCRGCGARNYDLVGISVNYQVRVVRHDDHLAAQARLSKMRHDLGEHRLRIQ